MQTLHTLHLLANRFERFQKILFWVLGGAAVIFIGLYMALISHTIVQVLVREDLERSIAHAASSAGELESEYVRKEGGITLQIAEGLGLGTPSAKIFIAKRALSRSGLSFNNEI